LIRKKDRPPAHDPEAVPVSLKTVYLRHRPASFSDASRTQFASALIRLALLPARTTQQNRRGQKLKKY
jgi:hypothetical protein